MASENSKWQYEPVCTRHDKSVRRNLPLPDRPNEAPIGLGARQADLRARLPVLVHAARVWRHHHGQRPDGTASDLATDDAQSPVSSSLQMSHGQIKSSKDPFAISVKLICDL